MTHNKVFISYSHQDKDFFKRLQVHLKALERNGQLDVWSDQKLKSGDDWRKEIATALQSASVAILLISADFLASEFIAKNELPVLLDGAEKRGTRIIPVILKPSAFPRTAELARFQAVNDPAKPLIRMSHAGREEIWDKVASIVLDNIHLNVLSDVEITSSSNIETNSNHRPKFDKEAMLRKIRAKRDEKGDSEQLTSSKLTLKYKSGQRVHHSEFGDGVVTTSHVVDGKEEVIVRFESMFNQLWTIFATSDKLSTIDP